MTNNRGGLSGPAIKPIAIAQVDQVYNSECSLPIIGIGGIADYRDVIEFMLVGAAAVQVGTALFIEPYAPLQITSDLKKYLREKRVEKISDLIGKVRKY